jgi:hypothetical protein
MSSCQARSSSRWRGVCQLPGQAGVGEGEQREQDGVGRAGGQRGEDFLVVAGLGVVGGVVQPGRSGGRRPPAEGEQAGVEDLGRLVLSSRRHLYSAACRD